MSVLYVRFNSKYIIYTTMRFLLPTMYSMSVDVICFCSTLLEIRVGSSASMRLYYSHVPCSIAEIVCR